MRIRKQDADGDYVFGGGLRDFYIDVPECCVLAAKYRLELDYAAWWLAPFDGTPWHTKVIGRRTESTRDAVLKNRILGTPGVTSVVNYSSALDRERRAFSVVSAELNTIYSTGPAALAARLGAANNG